MPSCALHNRKRETSARKGMQRARDMERESTGERQTKPVARTGEGKHQDRSAQKHCLPQSSPALPLTTRTRKSTTCSKLSKHHASQEAKQGRSTSQLVLPTTTRATHYHLRIAQQYRVYDIHASHRITTTMGTVTFKIVGRNGTIVKLTNF